jgi:hypothetical protein
VSALHYHPIALLFCFHYMHTFAIFQGNSVCLSKLQ